MAHQKKANKKKLTISFLCALDVALDQAEANISRSLAAELNLAD